MYDNVDLPRSNNLELSSFKLVFYSQIGIQYFFQMALHLAGRPILLPLVPYFKGCQVTGTDDVLKDCFRGENNSISLQEATIFCFLFFAVQCI